MAPSDKGYRYAVMISACDYSAQEKAQKKTMPLMIVMKKMTQMKLPIREEEATEKA